MKKSKNDGAVHTAILDTRTDLRKTVAAAVEILRRKELVALPTETVYGLVTSPKTRPFYWKDGCWLYERA